MIRSLIMCVTPLQMVIAEKIIKNKKDETFDIVVVSQDDNKRFMYYYDKLKDITNKQLFFKYNSSSEWSKFKSVLDFKREYKKSFFLKKYSKIYLASIDSRHFHYVLSVHKTAEVYTFDDGTANVIQNSAYFTDYRPNYLTRIVLCFLGINVYKDTVIQRSKKHYTIYKGCKNIIENTEFIGLIEGNNTVQLKKNKVVNLFLGQPMYEIDEIYNKKIVENCIKKLNIDLYYRHPREQWDLALDDVVIIDKELIVEDFVIEYLNNNPDVTLHIYSFISSALLNLASLQDVETKFIVDSFLLKRYRQFYEMASEKFGISYIEIE